jgi:hypothetical protein
VTISGYVTIYRYQIEDFPVQHGAPWTSLRLAPSVQPVSFVIGLASQQKKTRFSSNNTKAESWMVENYDSRTLSLDSAECTKFKVTAGSVGLTIGF